MKRFTLAFTGLMLATAFSYGQSANKQNITELYVATFNRAPDSAGLDYWVTKSNLSLEGISSSFFEQKETQDLYANLDNERFISSVYHNLFNRDVDSEGAIYWSNELNSGSISKENFILATINGAKDGDRTLLNQKTSAGLEFANSGSNDLDLAKETIANLDTNSSYCTDSNGVVLANYTKDELTEEQKYSLAYMWHEEKLAKEIYLELNKIFPTNQLEKIANNAETKHIEFVQNLVEWYDINITNVGDYTIKYSESELNSMEVGKFAIPAIEDLYNLLYEKGSVSQQASLEVGCMVEVTDIDDLDKYIDIAKDNKALLDTFNILRNGSYEHYWAFDGGLKNMGVTDGCCSLGTIYCHNEYPKGEDKGSPNGNISNGQGHKYGKD